MTQKILSLAGTICPREPRLQAEKQHLAHRIQHGTGLARDSEVTTGRNGGEFGQLGQAIGRLDDRIRRSVLTL